MRICLSCCLLITLLAIIHAPLMAQGPGFRGGRGGDPSFRADRDDFHALLGNHDKVVRAVTLLPNGIRTHTRSDDPQVAKIIQRHVPAMYDRLKTGRPVRMWDPLFRALFQDAEKVSMKVEPTADGVRVEETSSDPYVVLLIQEHAKVVSRFVEHGFNEAQKSHALPARDDKPVSNDKTPASPAEASGLTRAFIEFDQAFIPALALTNQNKPAQAKHALDRLREAWESGLAGVMTRAFVDDNAWPGDITKVVEAMVKAHLLLESDQCLEAHEALEPIRDLLMHARDRNDFAYPLDRLAEFHAVMEEIVKPAMKATPADVTPEYAQRVERLAAHASDLWSKVEQTDFALDEFGLSADKQKRFASLLKQERAAIDALTAALDADDPAKLLAAARAIKPPFAQAYMAFGKFPAGKASATP